MAYLLKPSNRDATFSIDSDLSSISSSIYEHSLIFNLELLNFITPVNFAYQNVYSIY